VCVRIFSVCVYVSVCVCVCVCVCVWSQQQEQDKTQRTTSESALSAQADTALVMEGPEVIEGVETKSVHAAKDEDILARAALRWQRHCTRSERDREREREREREKGRGRKRKLTSTQNTDHRQTDVQATLDNSRPQAGPASTRGVPHARRRHAAPCAQAAVRLVLLRCMSAGQKSGMKAIVRWGGGGGS
jgi:hypothetical protein